MRNVRIPKPCKYCGRRITNRTGRYQRVCYKCKRKNILKGYEKRLLKRIERFNAKPDVVDKYLIISNPENIYSKILRCHGCNQLYGSDAKKDNGFCMKCIMKIRHPRFD